MKLTLNLASRNYIGLRKVYIFYGALLIILGIILVINVFDVIHTQKQTMTIRAHLEEINVRDVDETPIDLGELDRMHRKIVFANEILTRKGFRWTELFNQLEELLQGGITIRSLRPDYRDGSLRIAGSTRNLEDLKGFIDRIQASRHFETVYLHDQHRVKIEGSVGLRKTALNFSLRLSGAF